MKEFIEKLIGRLEELRNDKYMNGVSRFTPNEKKVFDIAETIVNQLAEEYNGWWISADVELPKKNGWYWGYYVTSSYKGTDGVRHTECKYASIYWEDNLWLYDPRSFRTVDEVIAWKPIAPYQPKGE